MKTAMQELINTFHLYQNSGCSQEEQELLSFYIKCAKNLLEKERKQIESSWENGRNYPYNDCDGSKYYFMNYISND